MSVMQIRCDCCGEIIETGHHKLTLQCELHPAISSRDSATSDPAIDLCKPCFDDLHEWFAQSWSSTMPEDDMRRSTSLPAKTESSSRRFLSIRSLKIGVEKDRIRSKSPWRADGLNDR